MTACGAGASRRAAATTSARHPDPTVPAARPQAIEPDAGDDATGSTRASGTPAPARPGLDAPATITRAPAKGAASTAQVRLALHRLEVAQRRYRLRAAAFGKDLLDPSQLPAGRWFESVASFYDDFGDGVACGGVLEPTTIGVANRTLPCGTEVIFRYGERAIEVPVIDRGPYVAGREWDLTAATAVALGFPGLGPIRWQLAG